MFRRFSPFPILPALLSSVILIPQGMAQSVSTASDTKQRKGDQTYARKGDASPSGLPENKTERLFNPDFAADLQGWTAVEIDDARVALTLLESHVSKNKRREGKRKQVRVTITIPAKKTVLQGSWGGLSNSGSEGIKVERGKTYLCDFDAVSETNGLNRLLITLISPEGKTLAGYYAKIGPESRRIHATLSALPALMTSFSEPKASLQITAGKSGSFTLSNISLRPKAK